MRASVGVAQVDQDVDGFHHVLRVNRVLFRRSRRAGVPGAIAFRRADVLIQAVRQRVREEAGGRRFAAHGDVIHFVLTVDHQTERITHARLLLDGEGLAFRREILVHVEQDIVGAELLAHHEFAGIRGVQTLKLRGIHALNEIGRAGFIGCQDRNAVFRQVGIDTAQGHVFRVPVVGVLFEGGNVVHREVGHAEGAGADVGLQDSTAHAPSESARSTFTG